MVTWSIPIDAVTSPFVTWNLSFVLYNVGRNNSGIVKNRFIDMTLLLSPVSIKNLKDVPLTDASANQASPDPIFNETTQDLGFGRIV